MAHAGTHRSKPTLSSPPDAFAAFVGLADQWQLTTDQQITLLGSPARSTYFKWKKEGGQVSPDTEERISHLLAIFKALQILFPDPDRADAWLRRKNQFFDGRSALDVMLGGKLVDVISVRAYLDAQRGG
ncbi:MAG: DUF2384 domain-containing protein [Bradyrhizobiaceae bacterium]|nr:DUF2384 domain-containing protein [Bradyrhizobiaceae bacterium]